jgi:AraC family transcriptional regulator
MNKEDTVKDYQEKINRVLTYINNHLFEEMNVESIASVSHFSMFHFHRIMRAYLNEPLWSYIIRLRMEGAARLLELTDEAINEIGFKTGYENPPAFSKAFKNHFGITPLEYRNNKANAKINLIINPQIFITMKAPKIKEIKAMKVIYIQSVGEYGGEKMDETWKKLFDFVKKNKLFSFGMDCIGVGHDDPNITEPSKCRYDACLTIKKEVKPEGEVGVKTIEGGKFAIFRHAGSYDELGNVYNEIYHNWIPENKIELRDVPNFEIYVNNPNRTKPENLKTDIYVPIV